MSPGVNCKAPRNVLGYDPRACMGMPTMKIPVSHPTRLSRRKRAHVPVCGPNSRFPSEVHPREPLLWSLPQLHATQSNQPPCRRRQWLRSSGWLPYFSSATLHTQTGAKHPGSSVLLPRSGNPTLIFQSFHLDALGKIAVQPRTFHSQCHTSQVVFGNKTLRQ